MARVLAFSSYVAFGHVGLSAVTPVLTAMGHEVIAVPTVVLSNHRGYEDTGGFSVAPEQISKFLNALRANGWLSELDAVMTGYLDDPAQASLIAAAIEAMSEDLPDLIYLCDPVIGDDPNGLYVSQAVAEAVRDELVGLSDIVTPNRFELAWMTEQPVANPVDADAAAQELDTELVVATSIPAGDQALASIVSDADTAAMVATGYYHGVPHGTGDLFASLFLGHLLNDSEDGEALARAAAGTDLIIRASLGAEELRLIDNIRSAIEANPLDLVEV